jgi:AcrR family transcriptional regulator
MRGDDDTAYFRLTVVDQALRLFAEKGYEATTVDEIAEAAGISRRTFFRQFRSKEDVIFADHESQLAQAAEFLSASREDPWEAVCAAVVLVFERFTQWREIAARRYQVVRRVPALREREIVTVFRYERLFTDYLRERLPEAPDLARVQFTAAVTATHNYLLRRMVRGDLLLRQSADRGAQLIVEVLELDPARCRACRECRGSGRRSLPARCPTQADRGPAGPEARYPLRRIGLRPI